MFPHLHNIKQEFYRHSIKKLGFYRRGFEAGVTQQGDSKPWTQGRDSEYSCTETQAQMYGVTASTFFILS